MPYISVIVPVYNTEKELPRCIDSILGQSFADFELLLVNDGSTDGSGAICDDYAAKDSRVRVFHKENGGVSSARNRGLDNAVGEMVVFVDSDDQIEQGYFANAIDTDADIYYYHRMLSDGHFDSVIPCGVYYDEDLKNYLIENS
ncbi:MAG: glycosyltransferase, partial [Bacteroidales bacterium]|nr:glycosyltransferase [Bacteroidales bacterium]